MNAERDVAYDFATGRSERMRKRWTTVGMALGGICIALLAIPLVIVFWIITTINAKVADADAAVEAVTLYKVVSANGVYEAARVLAKPTPAGLFNFGGSGTWKIETREGRPVELSGTVEATPMPEAEQPTGHRAAVEARAKIGAAMSPTIDLVQHNMPMMVLTLCILGGLTQIGIAIFYRRRRDG